MKQFDSLSDTFNVNNDCEEIIEQTIAKKEEIQNGIKSQKYTIEDSEFIKTEIQDLIATNRQVLEALAESCKVGAPPRLFEVYATLSNTIAGNIMDLLKTEETITNYQVVEAKEELAKRSLESKEKAMQARLTANHQQNELANPMPTAIQNNYYFTSKELLKMALEAKKDAEINTQNIKPEFNLD